MIPTFTPFNALAKDARPVSTSLVHILRNNVSITITPEMASRILSETHWDGQRRISDEYTKVYAHMMMRGLWLDNSQLSFGLLDGSLYNINGRHRLSAVVASGKSVVFQVAVYPVTSLDELRDLYVRFDTVQRARSAPTVLDAFDLHDRLGVSKSTASALYKAVPFLISGLRAAQSIRGGEDQLKMKIMDLRLDVCLAWAKQAVLYDAALEGSEATLRRRLCAGGVVAVALITLKSHPEKAFEFWRGVAQNDGLKKGDPRHTLVNAILTHKRPTVTYGASLAAVAWNAWFEDRKLAYLRIYDESPIKILGTNVGRKKGA